MLSSNQLGVQIHTFAQGPRQIQQSLSGMLPVTMTEEKELRKVSAQQVYSPKSDPYYLASNHWPNGAPKLRSAVLPCAQKRNHLEVLKAIMNTAIIITISYNSYLGQIA